MDADAALSSTRIDILLLMWTTEILFKNMSADHDGTGITEGGKKCLHQHSPQRLSGSPEHLRVFAFSSTKAM